MLPGLNPDAIAKKMLLGDFGKALCVWLNKHQKGNKHLMERLTGTPYPLTAFTPELLYARVKGKEDATGLMVIFERMEGQQHDIIRALDASIKLGQELAAKQGLEVHGQVGKTVEVIQDGRAPQAAADGSGSTPDAQGTQPSDEAAAPAEPAAPDRDASVAEMRERQRLEDIEQARELTK